MATIDYQAFYQTLTQDFDTQHLWIGEAISPDFGHDELTTLEKLPDILVRPTTTQQVAKLMAQAYQANIPIVARGSGTGLVGGCVPIDGGLLLDLSELNQILELDEDNLTLTVESGAQLKDIAAYVEERNFLYAPDPGEKTATIGGNISTNAGGMRAVKYGVTRDSVRALTVVTPQGEVLHLGGKIVKNSSGFDLKDLYIGSEGTLGVITEAILKLQPLPKHSTSLLIPFEDFKAALQMVSPILQFGVTPTAIEFFEADIVQYWEQFANDNFPAEHYPAYLLLTYDGQSSNEIEATYEAIAEQCLENGAVDVFVLDTNELKQGVWKARDSFLEAIKASTTGIDEVDVVVPRSTTADFIDFTHQLSKKESIRISGFGHVGDGNLHLYVCQDDYSEDQWPTKLKEIFAAMYAHANELHGKVSGEHGIGFAKRAYLDASLEPAELALMRNIKQACDPKNLLNPQKVI